MKNYQRVPLKPIKNNESLWKIVYILLFMLFNILAFYVGMNRGKEQGKRAGDREYVKAMEHYVRIFPFEGDESYELFDEIFGLQDAEFYQDHTNFGTETKD